MNQSDKGQAAAQASLAKSLAPEDVRADEPGESKRLEGAFCGEHGMVCCD